MSGGGTGTFAAVALSVGDGRKGANPPSDRSGIVRDPAAPSSSVSEQDAGHRRSPGEPLSGDHHLCPEVSDRVFQRSPICVPVSAAEAVSVAFSRSIAPRIWDTLLVVARIALVISSSSAVTATSLRSHRLRLAVRCLHPWQTRPRPSRQEYESHRWPPGRSCTAFPQASRTRPRFRRSDVSVS